MSLRKLATAIRVPSGFQLDAAIQFSSFTVKARLAGTVHARSVPSAPPENSAEPGRSVVEVAGNLVHTRPLIPPRRPVKIRGGSFLFGETRRNGPSRLAPPKPLPVGLQASALTKPRCNDSLKTTAFESMRCT